MSIGQMMGATGIVSFIVHVIVGLTMIAMGAAHVPPWLWMWFWGSVALVIGGLIVLKFER